MRGAFIFTFMAVIDCFTYNGERDILKLRLNILAPYVDRFIIVEAKTTFSGRKKNLYFSEQERSFKEWWPKIRYYVIREDYSNAERRLAENSPNTKGAAHWVNEFLQKESVLKALAENHVKDRDTVYIGDVDEIWNPHYFPAKRIEKLKLYVFAYYINNLSSEQFWGPIVGQYQDIKDECLNHLRSDTRFMNYQYAGWHFTSMGGLDEVRRKLNASYTEGSYNTPEVKKLLPYRIEKGIDYLGRQFQFELTREHWPEYLKHHVEDYLHLYKVHEPN